MNTKKLKPLSLLLVLAVAGCNFAGCKKDSAKREKDKYTYTSIITDDNDPGR